MNRIDKLRQALNTDEQKILKLFWDSVTDSKENKQYVDAGVRALEIVKQENARLSPLHKVLCDAVAAIEHHIDCRDNYKATDLRSLDKALTAIDAVLEET